MSKIRVAVVGVGEMGVERASLARVLPEYEFVCLVDSSMVRAHLAGRLLELPVQRSLEAALARDNLDAVMISTPEETHKDLALQAIRAGKHVLLEKPLTGRWEDSLALWEAARGAGVVHMVDYNLRNFPTFRRLKEYLAEGRLGDPQYIQATAHDGIVLGQEGENTGLPNLFSLFGVHVLDLVCWYMGPPVEVVATARQVHSPSTPDFITVLFRFQNGAIGVVDLGWSHWKLARGEQRRITVTGRDGSALVDDDALVVHLRESESEPRGGTTTLRLPDIPMAEAFGITGKRLAFGMQEFAAAIFEHRDAHPNWEDGMVVDTVVEAILQSAAQQRAVHIDWEPQVTLTTAGAVPTLPSAQPPPVRGWLSKILRSRTR